MSETITLVLILVFLLAVALAVLATGYMGRIYRRSYTPRSWFFRMMLNSSIIKVICGVILGYQTGTYLLIPLGIKLPRIPSDISAPLLLAIAIILISPPIYYGWTILQVRRKGVYDPEIELARRTAEGTTGGPPISAGPDDR